MTTPALNEDYLDLLRAFVRERVAFLIVGAHALAVHGVPRATGDLDLLVRPDPPNAERVITALRSFGAPLATHGVSAADFARPGMVYQIGVAPRRIDVLTAISGVSFEEAWAGHTQAELQGLRLPVLGRAALLRNKRAAGRTKDLADAEQLERLEGQSPSATSPPS